MHLNLIPSIKIHICDDHPIVIEGILTILSTLTHAKSTFSNSKEELLTFIKTNKIDLLFLDINVKSCNMLALIPKIRQIQPELKIILFTNYNSKEVIKEVVKYNIEAFLDKMASPDEILYCVATVMNEQKYLSFEKKSENFKKDNYQLLKELTDREIDILKLLVKGNTNKQIADVLCISVLTVQTHRKNIYQKLQLKGVNELVSFAYENNLY